MKRCNFCNGPFGLIRHRSGGRQFCKKRCERIFNEHKEKQIALIRWLTWLRVISP